MEALSKLIALILVVVLLSLFPLQYLLSHHLTLLENYVENETVQLVDDMRDKEYLDVEMYDAFLKRLSTTGLMYDIEIEHAVAIDGADTVSAEDLEGIEVVSNSLQSLSTMISENDKVKTAYESQKELGVDAISSLAAHGHVEACYDGHRHGESGCVPSGNTFDIADLNFGQSFANSAGDYGVRMYIWCSEHYFTSFSIEYKNYSGDNGGYFDGEYMDTIEVTDSSGLTVYKRYLYSPTPQEGYYYYSNSINSGYRKIDPMFASRLAEFDNFIYQKFGSGISNVGHRRTWISGSNVSLPFGRKHTGCKNYYHLPRIGPTVDVTFSSNYVVYSDGSGGWSSYHINCRTCGNAVAQLRYTYTSNGYDEMTFYQYYYTGNSVSRAINRNIKRMSGYTVNPEWDYYMNLRASIYVPGHYYNNVNKDALYSFGYKDKYSCHNCIKNGNLPWNIDTPYSCDSDEDTTPICNQVVTALSPTNQAQTVFKGGSIITTANATYLDGHTEVVNCTSNFNNQVVGNQTVTLTYSGLIRNAKTTGTITTTIDVNVIENNLPASISVIPSSHTVYNGQEPSYTVTVTYTSGQKKAITSGYIKTGWSSGPGIKTVTFTYTENGKTVSTSVNVTVKPNLTRITVSPSLQTIERYQNPNFSVIASFEDSSSTSVMDYSVNGLNYRVIGMQNVTIIYTVGGVTKSQSVTVNVTPMKRTCPDCGTVYDMDANDFDPGCPICKITITSIQVSPELIHVIQGDPLPITVTATYRDGHTEAVTGWSSNYNPSVTGFQIVMVTYMGSYDFVNVNVKSAQMCSICGARYSLNEDGTDPGCPACKTELVGISASPDTQTVREGEELNLLVYGVYRDGHSEPVTGWTSNFDNRRPGAQQVFVYYNNKSCSVSVVVITEHDVQCGTCSTIYNRLDNPWGCPACRDTVVGITAALKSGGTKVTIGYAIDLKVIITYRDGRRVIITEGWEDNFNPYQMGTQTVTVSYTDKFSNKVSCMITIGVVDSLQEKVCENGHTYHAEEEGDSCPYCEGSAGATTRDLFHCTFTEEIIDKVYTDGIYRFKKGDYITIKIKVRIKGSIYSFKLYGKEKKRALISYGGEVK